MTETEINPTREELKINKMGIDLEVNSLLLHSSYVTPGESTINAEFQYKPQ